MQHLGIVLRLSRQFQKARNKKIRVLLEVGRRGLVSQDSQAMFLVGCGAQCTPDLVHWAFVVWIIPNIENHTACVSPSSP